MRASRIFACFIVALVATFLTVDSARAQTLTKVLVTDQVTNPVYVTAPVVDYRRLFVVQQNGIIRIVKAGQLLPTPYLDLGTTGLNKISTGSERGLLGLAFHPKYRANGFFYVSYTNLQGMPVIERYQVSADPAVANPASGTLVLGPITHPQSNHNGGCLQFGPDGKLYFGMGDGGGSNDSGPGHAPEGNGQSGATLLGKIMRLDVDLPYPHIPPDNPFVGNPNYMDEIWMLGVRNPWRFSFDRVTGDFWLGDVGEVTREEVDFAPAGVGGLNFGWRCMEGFNCTGLSGCTCNAPSLTLPVYDYAHGSGCASAVGGYVYRGRLIPGLEGTYFFADYCKRKVWTFQFVGGQVTNLQDRTNEIVNTGGTLSTISSFGEDALGELYLTDVAGGRVYRITQ